MVFLVSQGGQILGQSPFLWVILNAQTKQRLGLVQALEVPSQTAAAVVIDIQEMRVELGDPPAVFKEKGIVPGPVLFFLFAHNALLGSIVLKRLNPGQVCRQTTQAEIG